MKKETEKERKKEKTCWPFVCSVEMQVRSLRDEKSEKEEREKGTEVVLVRALYNDERSLGGRKKRNFYPNTLWVFSSAVR